MSFAIADVFLWLYIDFEMFDAPGPNEGAPVQKEAGASSPTRRPFEAKLAERSDGIPTGAGS